MLVRDVMVSDVYTAKPTDTLVHVAALMKRHNVGAMPICEGDRLAGIITDRDMTVECLAGRCDPTTSQVSEFMTADPVCVSPETSLTQAAEIMGHEQVRRLCVCDEHGRLIGILALSDLAVALFDDRLLAETLRRMCAPLRPSFTPVDGSQTARERELVVAGARRMDTDARARPEWEDMLGSEL